MLTTIHVERAKKRITQSELAKIVGVSRQTIHGIETGKMDPGLTISMKIAKFFGQKVEDIFILDEESITEIQKD